MNKQKWKKRMAKWRRRNTEAGGRSPTEAAAPAPGTAAGAGREPPRGGGSGGGPGERVDQADGRERPDRADRSAGAAGNSGVGMAGGAGVGVGPGSRREPPGKLSVESVWRVVRRVRSGADVGEAIVAEGMSRAQFYARLARDPKLGEFAQGMRLGRPLEVLEDELLERAVFGVARPIFRGGEQVGEERVRSDSLLIWMLEQYVPEKYGKRDEEGQPPPPREIPDPLAAARAKAVGELVVEEAFRRAMEGVERPVFHRGEQVGTVVARSDRLLKYLYTAELRSVAEAARKARAEGAGSDAAVGEAEGRGTRSPGTERFDVPGTSREPSIGEGMNGDLTDGVDRGGSPVASAASRKGTGEANGAAGEPESTAKTARGAGVAAADAAGAKGRPGEGSGEGNREPDTKPEEIPDNVAGFESQAADSKTDTDVYARGREAAAEVVASVSAGVGSTLGSHITGRSEE